MTGPFDLNLRHLRALSAILDHGALNAAAGAIGLSQPALTQGLAKLERQLGAALFQRHPDGLTPTEAGVAFAARAQAAVAHLAVAAGGMARGGGRGFARPDRLMTSTQLHALLSLADAGGFTDAATATGLSQPALHRAVRDLEQICDVALAERRGRRVALTAAGRRLARGVRLAAGEIAAGIVDISADGAEAGRIVVGAMPLSRALVLPHAIAAFLQGAPRAVLDVVEGSWRDLVEPLRDGVLDLTIGALRDPPPAGLEQRPLFEDRLVVVARAGHPLAETAAPGVEDFAPYGWIVARRETPLRDQWAGLFDGRPPDAPVECGSVMTIRGLLCRSDLLTLLSPDQVALEVNSGLLTTLGPPLSHGVRTIGVTTRVGWRPTAAQRRFLDLLDRAAAETRLPENK